ncbi:MAG: Hsp20/alpha crystallin family protein [Gammaproteobacteria bacterium]|jgi:HSP20 family protein
MAMIPYESWSPVSQLQDELNRVFNAWSTNDTSGVTADWIPATDIVEYSDRFELYIDLPGVDPNAVEITLDNGVLTLSGERTRLVSGEEEGEPTHRRTERGRGRFYRRFILPETVDTESVEARGSNGVLEIRILKQPKAQPRRITVAA